MRIRLKGEIDYAQLARERATDDVDSLRRTRYSHAGPDAYSIALQARRRQVHLPARETPEEKAA